MSRLGISNVSRRGFLVGSGLVAGATALQAPALADRSEERFPSYTWSGSTSQNGWPIQTNLPNSLIEGSAGVTMATTEGAAATVLSYVSRRYLYEIDWKLRPEDVVGYRSSRKIRADFESNYLSGTAITIREDLRPLGGFDGLYPFEVKKVEAILDSLEGVVVWGGHLDPMKQSHFEIAVTPDDPILAQIAERIESDQTFINPQ